MRLRPISTLAQDYPSRPIRAIINVSAGGTADVFLRTLGEGLHRRLGQPLIIDPRPGGGFIVAGRACAEAPPDGYTICVLSGETLVYNEFLFKKLPYDPRKDFAPITNFFFNTQALVVNATLGVRTLDQLARACQGQAEDFGLMWRRRFRSGCFSNISTNGTGLIWCVFRSRAAARP